MNENIKRNHRKSKIELRECSDDEDENILALQAGIEKLVNLKKNLLNCSKEEQDPKTSVANAINFQVQVKVEQCADNDDTQSNFLDLDNAPAAGGGESKSDHSSARVDKPQEYEYYLRILQPAVKGCDRRKVTEYMFTTSSIRRGLAAQAKLNISPADRYIQIALNNVHGEIRAPPRSHHDELLQKCLQEWNSWYDVSAGVKDTPLLYKCYICNRGWWRLHPFREHLKDHDDPHLTVKAEPHPYEFHVVASAKDSDEMKDVAVDGNCWRCEESLKYHKNKTSNYQCVGCKGAFITCTKLKSHHVTCVKYVELKFKRHIQSSKPVWACSLCRSHYTTEKQLHKHLIGQHSPRSDDPVPAQGDLCKFCKMNFFIQNYHNCPNKFCLYKCSYCCRKFVSNALLDLHNEVFSKVTVKCEVCGQSLRECMLLEHMLVHTKNYGAVYWCRKCDYNILFTKYAMLVTHMRYHTKSTEMKRYACKMLLPTKCINGEFVASVRTVDISESKVVDFITGKNNIKSIYPRHRRKVERDIVASGEVRITKDCVDNVKASEGNESAANDDTKELALQLDAEIKRDLEMEEALSKVFRASNCYKKFLEKESAEPIDDYTYDDDVIILEKPNEVLIVVDSDTDDEKGAGANKDTDDEREVKQIDRVGNVKPDTTRVIEPPIPHPADEESDFDENLIIKEESNANSDFDEHEYENTRDSAEPHDEGEVDGASFTFDIDIKNEPLHSDVDEAPSKGDCTADLSQSSAISAVKVNVQDSNPDTEKKKETAKRCAKRASANDNNKAKKAKTKIKKIIYYKAEVEHDYDGEEPILDPIKEPDNSSVHDAETFIDANIKEESNYSAEYLDSDELDNDVDWSTQLQKEKDEAIKKKKIENISKPGDSRKPTASEKPTKAAAGDKLNRKGSRIYTCSNCSFTAKYRKYIEHMITSCSSKCWSCTRCSNEYENMYMYVEHLKDDHGAVCPDCREVMDSMSHLHRHVVMHVRGLFFNEGKYLTDVSWRYECRKCNAVVGLEELFSHWESHLGVEEEDAAAGGGADKTDMERLSPVVVQGVIKRLLMNGKWNKGQLAECRLCPKKFDRKNDTKRHLIEHLLSEALRDKADTNNSLRCPICCDDLPDVYTWKQHMRDHADLPEYQCKLCKKRFSDSSNFAKHKKVHNFYSYVCDICGSKFQAHSSMVKHIMLHDQPPVHCKVCSAPFYSNSRLKVHMKQRHQLNTFPCIVCKKRFGSLKDKWDHMWIEHKQRTVKADCPLCMKSYRRRSDVKNHLKEEHGDQPISEIYKMV